LIGLRGLHALCGNHQHTNIESYISYFNRVAVWGRAPRLRDAGERNLSAGITGATSEGPASLPAPSQALADIMRVYWTDFAASANPNPLFVPYWQPSVSRNIQLLVPPLPRIESDATFNTEHHCAFWD